MAKVPPTCLAYVPKHYHRWYCSFSSSVNFDLVPPSYPLPTLRQASFRAQLCHGQSLRHLIFVVSSFNTHRSLPRCCRRCTNKCHYCYYYSYSLGNYLCHMKYIASFPGKQRTRDTIIRSTLTSNCNGYQVTLPIPSHQPHHSLASRLPLIQTSFLLSVIPLVFQWLYRSSLHTNLFILYLLSSSLALVLVLNRPTVPDVVRQHGGPPCIAHIASVYLLLTRRR